MYAGKPGGGGRVFLFSSRQMQQQTGKWISGWPAGAMALSAVLALLLVHVWQQGEVKRRNGRMAKLPRVTLWAWDRPAFLEGFNAVAFTRVGMRRQAVAVASLDQTIRLGPGGITTRQNLQPVVFPAGAVREAVVRIKADPDAVLSAATVDATVKLLLHSAQQPGIAALQVDFGATRAQRDFYRSVLRVLRAGMRQDLPLSIIAPASWCTEDDWIHDLPIDEAVPVFFRTAQDAPSENAERSTEDRVREPLCGGSIGLSVNERWPALKSGQRLYLFADYGWQPSTIQAALMRLE